MNRHWYIDQAHQDLDSTGSAVAQGANLAPDYVMRLIIAIRSHLNLHQPGGPKNRCMRCDEDFPCSDVRADLALLGIDPDDEPEAGAR